MSEAHSPVSIGRHNRHSNLNAEAVILALQCSRFWQCVRGGDVESSVPFVMWRYLVISSTETRKRQPKSGRPTLEPVLVLGLPFLRAPSWRYAVDLLTATRVGEMVDRGWLGSCRSWAF